MALFRSRHYLIHPPHPPSIPSNPHHDVHDDIMTHHLPGPRHLQHHRPRQSFTRASRDTARQGAAGHLGHRCSSSSRVPAVLIHSVPTPFQRTLGCQRGELGPRWHQDWVLGAMSVAATAGHARRGHGEKKRARGAHPPIPQSIRCFFLPRVNRSRARTASTNNREAEWISQDPWAGT